MTVLQQAGEMVVTILFAALVGLLIIGGTIAVIVLVKRKEQKEGRADATEQERRLDYSRFNRKDVEEYTKFDDIVDFGWGGAIVMDNGRRFVAGLAVTGYDYAMASAEERFRSLVGMQSMANMISWPVQIHQDSRRADLTTYVQRCEERIGKMETAIEAYESDRNVVENSISLLMEGQPGEDKNFTSALKHYNERLDFIDREIEAMHNLIREQQAQITDMKRRSEDFNPIRSHKYMIDWTYRPQEYSTRQLEGAEIIREAKDVLERRLGTLASALGSTGVSTHKMSADELLTAEYVHYHPLSGGYFRIEDIRDSQYFYPYLNADNSELLDEVENEIAVVERYRQDYENDLREQAEIEYLEDEARKEGALALDEADRLVNGRRENARPDMPEAEEGPGPVWPDREGGEDDA